MPPVQSTDRPGIKYTLSHLGNAGVDHLDYVVVSACSSLLIIVNGYNSPVIHFTHFSAKENLRSKRLAEAKDAILFPRVYDTGPHYHRASVPRDPKTSNMISSKLTSWRGIYCVS